MTICIAAFSHQDGSLVAVSDQMMTIGGRTADDAALKQWWIHGHWCALFAGDAGIATSILQDARGHLVEGQTYQPTEVGRVVADAWIRSRVRLAEAKVLSAYGVSMNEFVARGAKQFQPAEYSRICNAIEGVNPECDFLVCGFSGEEGSLYPHVMSVQDGIASDFDSMGYWAIGSGADLALGALSARRHSFRFDTATTLYNLLEARFAAEADPAVGRGQTLAMTWDYPFAPACAVVPDHVIEAIRALWIRHRSTPPPGAVALIQSVLARPLGQRSDQEGERDPQAPKGEFPDQPPSPE